ncbi:MAG: hypothetical protein A2788_02030 [Candidatus Abawacabacteria bacterium RIFCSPHIGHO2_01_FULL_46_8]|uniref:Cysteine desulfurase n=1 Tax=Candidatus Abawacabacteria bacterium RIFCSPHIGHO2_01_FULL_46_8 TaxID=1817815 RepID=A0A1F4XIT6_9BACT|nr:MAG: hypothetical protein A2788_02030 [Candidatus Abawacabacteria bacterium RIFCSPHIGHO2_01_FULL_46_8]
MPISKLTKIKQHFPIFSQQQAQPLIYLDSAATAQKPELVLEAVQEFYERDNANIHRGIYDLSLRATAAYDEAREAVARHLNAACAAEIIFTRNATEAINLVANCLGRAYFKPGDRILLTKMEHHSNIVPWQMQAEQLGLELVYLDITAAGQLDLSKVDELLAKPTKLFALTHVSNVLGTINPLKELVARAQAVGVPVLVDGCQAVPHLTVDVQDLACDFYVFSGHKVGGPTGIGVLYAKRAWLEKLPPFLGGGDMIEEVTLTGFTTADLPNKFEAGTPNLAGAVGLKAALDFLNQLGWDNIRQHDQELMTYARQQLAKLDFVQLLGPSDPSQVTAALSFVIPGIHPHDIAEVLNQDGVCVRAGHHCAQPLMAALGISACTRLSFWLYNSRADIDALCTSLKQVRKIFTPAAS